MVMLMIVTIPSLALVSIFAEKPIHAYYFYNESCAHCQEESLFLSSLESEYADFHVYRYDVVSSVEARDLFDSVREAFNMKTVLTPFLVIGGTAFVGFSDQVETDIRTTLLRYQTEEFVDVVAKIIANEPFDPTDIEFIRFSRAIMSHYHYLGPWRLIRCRCFSQRSFWDLSMDSILVPCGFWFF
jgi:thiol-disulfide isomerase/thioredoxin